MKAKNLATEIVQVLRIQKGDSLIIKTEDLESFSESEALSAMLSKHYGFSIPVIIVEKTTKFQILRKK